MDPETTFEEQKSNKPESKETTTVNKDANESHTVPQALDSLDLAALQLHQLNAAQTQALAAAAAAALSGDTVTENYQQLFANFDSNNAIQAAAAAIVAANTSNTNETNTSGDNLVHINQLPSAELLKRELMNQKVRADNRERKKRWRLQNEERNKDNDLRCRVNKRAHKLFGREDSDHKKRWVTEEFLKRQQKRKEKERRRGLVDNSLSGHSNYSNINDTGFDLAALAQQLVSQQSQQQQQQIDTNYLALLCNNLGIPNIARSILDNTNNPVTAPSPTTTTTITTTTTTTIITDDDNDDDNKQEKAQQQQQQQQLPLQLLELLQQLQQYQQPQQETVSGLQLSSGTNDDDSKIEEKIAALLASTFQAVIAAANNNQDEIKPVYSTAKEEEQQQDEDNRQNAEFPMDAVLTLMQLNAGWRQ